MVRKSSKSFLAQLFGGRYGKPDYIFLASFFILLTIGLIMLSSASVVVSYKKFDNSSYYLIHQILFGLLPGLALFTLFSRIDYHILKRFAFLFLVISLVLLAMVFLPGLGYEYGGARRWMHLGSILFQPSEVVKLTFLLYLAAWLGNRGEKKVGDFSYGFIPFAAVVSIISFLIILQPDMGTMAVIALTAFCMYVVAGARMKHIALAAGGGFILLLILIKSASYRLERFTTFLHPELDPLGIGYHINQALLAIGTGGFWGRGFGHSRQKFAYLPEVTGDSIFAIIAEELGFFFVILFLSLFIFVILRGLRIAQHAPDTFGLLVGVGIMSWIGCQTFINIGAMLSLLPLTGIPLPFVSYGGSAMAVLLAAMGIMTNISRSRST
ncbi:putative lipid II flippase FtsW [Candidatus Uhrbacteria bacterium]|nr:putative lipid II flippase FtsW [Candidatus Uhrbacteria bacterium]